MSNLIHIIKSEETNLTINNINYEELTKKLKEIGAVLLSGFNANLSDFENFAMKFSSDVISQAYKQVRPESKGIAQELTMGTHSLVPHQERGYCPLTPDLCLFYGISKADEGGEFNIVNGNTLLNSITSSVIDLFREYKLRFKHTMEEETLIPRYPSLDYVKEILPTLKGVEFLRYRENIKILEFEYVTDAIHVSPLDRKEYFCNSAEIIWNHTYGPLNREVGSLRNTVEFSEYGNPIPKNAIDEIRKACKNIQLSFIVQPGDIIILDNWRYMHGRNAFKGDRKGKNIFLRQPEFRPKD